MIGMIANKPDANYLIITKALWLGSELAIVADSGLWDEHSIALASGNRYKAESWNTAILHGTKNAPVPKNRSMKFRYRDSPLTLLLGFWCFTITFLLYAVWMYIATPITLLYMFCVVKITLWHDKMLWEGHGIALVAGKRYKDELRKRRHSPQYEKSPAAEAVGDSI